MIERKSIWGHPIVRSISIILIGLAVIRQNYRIDRIFSNQRQINENQQQIHDVMIDLIESMPVPAKCGPVNNNHPLDGEML